MAARRSVEIVYHPDCCRARRVPSCSWRKLAAGLAMLVYPPRTKITASDSSSPWSADCRAPRHQKEPKCPGKPRYLHGQFHQNGTWVSCQMPAAISNNESVFEMVFLDVGAVHRAMEGADPWSRLIQGFRACPLISQGVTHVRVMPGCQPRHKPGHGRSMTQRGLSVC